MEELEDTYDIQTDEIAYKRWVETGKEEISMEAVLKEFCGLDDEL